MARLEASSLYKELRETVLQEAIQQGIQQERRNAVETFLKLCFGEIDPELEAIAPKLIALPVEEFCPLILQRSREELLARFSDR